MRTAFALVLLAAAAAVVVGQTTQCHYDCYNFKGSDGQMLKTNAVAACKADNVAGTPTFSSGPSYFQANSGATPGQGCTLSACTPFSGAGYGSTYSDCEHATPEWKALTNPANTTSNAARANANKPCTACPSA
ncbi:g10097 [Coccomyxa viridis]|uniref:G10097 protein n=1 Tax=Coccomyxa viridis TaxID=1274662 RepID=A0ABP1G5X4_9CHLO